MRTGLCEFNFKQDVIYDKNVAEGARPWYRVN